MGLSLARVGRGGHLYYLRAASPDGPGARAEPPGWWLGRGSAALGLEGRVEAADLAGVLAGVDPLTGEVLNPAAGRVRVVAFDLTFAAPKSASVLFGLGPPAVADQVEAGHRRAAEAALGYLERPGLGARRRAGGDERVLAADGAVAAAFEHRTSRAADPHLHAHVLVANLARGPDGRWSALEARALWLHVRTAGFLYEAHLRHELSRRLGVAWGEVRHGRADIAGLPAEVLAEFSRRGRQIQAHLEARGLSGPRAAAVAALATRPARAPASRLDELRPQWRARAAELGLGPVEVAGVLGRQGPEAGGRREPGLGALAGGGRGFSRQDALRAACEELVAAEVWRLESLVDRALAGPGWRRLARERWSEAAVQRPDGRGRELGPSRCPPPAPHELARRADLERLVEMARSLGRERQPLALELGLGLG
jgi:conjugative relaxase-like TrwC/TraI family protein